MNKVILPGYRPQFGGHVLFNDMKAWLPVNEKAGSRLNNIVNALNNAAMTGGSWVGNGVSLDGTDDLITLRRVAGMTDWTVAITYTPHTVSGSHSLVDQGDILIEQVDAGIRYGFNSGIIETSLVTQTKANILTTGTPVDIMVTKHGSVHTLYIDGVQSDTFTDATAPDTSETSLTVGRRVSPG